MNYKHHQGRPNLSNNTHKRKSTDVLQTRKNSLVGNKVIHFIEKASSASHHSANSLHFIYHNYKIEV